MKQESLQLTGGNFKDNRRALDFYPTPKDVTHALMNFLVRNDILYPKSVVWEPACGNLAMSNVIAEYGMNVISTDITTGDDYLNTEKDCYAIITNPPFNLSHLFIQKAIVEADVVCMLLKSQYWHAAKRQALFHQSKPAYVLPLTWRPDFLEHERLSGKKGAPTMEVAWTIWTYGNKNNCQYIPLRK